MIKPRARRVAFISSYKPRKCGIATFASDLVANVQRAGKKSFEPVIIAMESEKKHRYGKEVKFVIRRNVKHDYITAAEFINLCDIDMVCIQHEFGLFGGQGGSDLSLLLNRINVPVVTTLHTVLQEPADEYYHSMTDVCSASEKVIVMNKRGTTMLREIYGVSSEKIKVIPHGIPDIPFVDNGPYKRQLGLRNRKVILTFGLLGRGKGIEMMIKSMAEVVRHDPSVVYLVVGAMHPEIPLPESLSYKLQLDKMVSDLALQDNVVFHDRFVSNKQLARFLQAADLYVTPYPKKEQLTSGTLAFAVGAGNAVVSTPYWAAEELLAQGRGRLVDFGDCRQMAGAIVEILNDKALLSSMQKKAYHYGREMLWTEVGRMYWNLFNSIWQQSQVAQPIAMPQTFWNRSTVSQPATVGFAENNRPIGQRQTVSNK